MMHKICMHGCQMQPNRRGTERGSRNLSSALHGQIIAICRSYGKPTFPQKDAHPTYQCKDLGALGIGSSIIFERGTKGRLYQSSHALSAAPSPLTFEAAIMNIYLSSMFIGLGPITERLDKAVLASLCEAAASLSFLLASCKLTPTTIMLYQNIKRLSFFWGGRGACSSLSHIQINFSDLVHDSHLAYTLVHSKTNIVRNFYWHKMLRLL